MYGALNRFRSLLNSQRIAESLIVCCNSFSRHKWAEKKNVGIKVVAMTFYNFMCVGLLLNRPLARIIELNIKMTDFEGLWWARRGCATQTRTRPDCGGVSTPQQLFIMMLQGYRDWQKFVSMSPYGWRRVLIHRQMCVAQFHSKGFSPSAVAA